MVAGECRSVLSPLKKILFSSPWLGATGGAPSRRASFEIRTATYLRQRGGWSLLTAWLCCCWGRPRTRRDRRRARNRVASPGALRRAPRGLRTDAAGARRGMATCCRYLTNGPDSQSEERDYIWCKEGQLLPFEDFLGELQARLPPPPGAAGSVRPTSAGADARPPLAAPQEQAIKRQHRPEAFRAALNEASGPTRCCFRSFCCALRAAPHSSPAASPPPRGDPQPPRLCPPDGAGSRRGGGHSPHRAAR